MLANWIQKSESNLIAIEHKNMGLYKKKSLINNLFGAARETRTLTGKPHLALNQACLPIPA